MRSTVAGVSVGNREPPATTALLTKNCKVYLGTARHETLCTLLVAVSVGNSKTSRLPQRKWRTSEVRSREMWPYVGRNADGIIQVRDRTYSTQKDT